MKIQASLRQIQIGSARGRTPLMLELGRLAIRIPNAPWYLAFGKVAIKSLVGSHIF